MHFFCIVGLYYTGSIMAFLVLLLISLDGLHRTPMLDKCNLRCLCLLSCIAVCRFELLSTWLSLRRANLAL